MSIISYWELSSSESVDKAMIIMKTAMLMIMMEMAMMITYDGDSEDNIDEDGDVYDNDWNA